ncbi:MAG: hypothetical protein AAF657_03920 [Acidobacteriota bacterium]
MDPPFTLPFDTFWNWLVTHPNCILRAGTPEVVVYDDDDLHWHFATEGNATLLVQVLRGKRLMGELLLDPEQITYVQGVAGQHDEDHVFELIAESEKDRVVAYFFVLTHSFETEDEKPLSPGRVH